jgi:drug/metabolite transporter (DMT)-like permease
MALSTRHLAYLAMLGAVTIYGTNFAIARHAVLNGLTALDLTALRFAFAGLILLPFFLRWGIKDCAGLGWKAGLVATLLSGLPMTLLMLNGLALSPAAHGATIAPGTVTVVGVLGGILLFRVKPGLPVIAGVTIIVSGLAAIAFSASTSGAKDVLLGDLLFLATGLVWGLYPLLQQLWKLDALRATAALSVLSMFVYLPWYVFVHGAGNLANVPLWVIIAHGLNQGVLNVIIGLWLWGWAVGKIGASVTGRFPPLIPVIGTLTAIPLVGEIPGPLQWLGIAMIVGGLVLTTRK